MDPSAFSRPTRLAATRFTRRSIPASVDTVHLGRLLGPAEFARTVAIRRLRPQFAKDAELVSMLLDGARLAARVRHPNVVPALDVVTAGEMLVVMEYVHGESLAKLLGTLRGRDGRRLHFTDRVGRLRRSDCEACTPCTRHAPRSPGGSSVLGDHDASPRSTSSSESTACPGGSISPSDERAIEPGRRPWKRTRRRRRRPPRGQAIGRPMSSRPRGCSRRSLAGRPLLPQGLSRGIRAH